MQTFFIDFCGCCEIEAETPEQAAKEFWRLVREERSLPQNLYEIENVEKKTI